MSVVWEEPPGGFNSRVRGDHGPLRKEMETMAEELASRPGLWARLWDFENKEDAEKRSGAFRSVTGKGWNVALRQGQHGWSIYARKAPEEDQPSEETPTFQ